MEQIILGIDALLSKIGQYRAGDKGIEAVSQQQIAILIRVRPQEFVSFLVDLRGFVGLKCK